MKKFSAAFKKDKTQVLIGGSNVWHTVREIHSNRTLIQVDGLSGSFQRGHVVKFTNKPQ